MGGAETCVGVGAEAGSCRVIAVDACPSRANRGAARPGGPALGTGDRATRFERLAVSDQQQRRHLVKLRRESEERLCCLVDQRQGGIGRRRRMWDAWSARTVGGSTGSRS